MGRAKASGKLILAARRKTTSNCFQLADFRCAFSWGFSLAHRIALAEAWTARRRKLCRLGGTTGLLPEASRGEEATPSPSPSRPEPVAGQKGSLRPGGPNKLSKACKQKNVVLHSPLWPQCDFLERKQLLEVGTRSLPTRIRCVHNGAAPKVLCECPLNPGDLQPTFAARFLEYQTVCFGVARPPGANV